MMTQNKKTKEMEVSLYNMEPLIFATYLPGIAVMIIFLFYFIYLFIFCIIACL